ncbi:MAG TPA: YihY/virulence factor BrkB family protein [Candidatus Acidoferrum sp.]|nr:YihY/virulence factor BrkB family protein [Candidatus Acidoferrum sp.]
MNAVRKFHPIAYMTPSIPSGGQNYKTIWKLGGLTPWELSRRVVYDAIDDDLIGRASGLAFDFLLALFPFLVFLLAMFGLFASQSIQLRTGLLSYFATFLPPLAFLLLKNTTEELAKTANGGKLTLGILLALWFASGGVASMISTLNVAYRTREDRSWFKVRAIALALTLVISILIFAALCLVLVGGIPIDWIGEELQFASAMVLIWKALQWPLAALFVTFSYALIYSCGPNARNRRWYWITPGSVFGGLLWLVASAGFRVYLRYINTYTAIYGSLGALIILVVWLYVSGLAFLIGGEINANIERAAAEHSAT